MRTLIAMLALAVLAPFGASAQSVRLISARREHTCAVMSDGTARCWGNGRSGQLGDGTTETRWTPTPVQGLTDVVHLSAGGEHVCAVMRDGSVACWGENRYGQLGDGTESARLSPVRVSGLGGAAIAIAAGAAHTCALLADGTVRCWGENLRGEVGPGARSGRSATRTIHTSEGPYADSERSTTPVPVRGLRGVIAISAGRSTSCAISRRGVVRCWGALEPGGPTPRALPGVASATQLALDWDGACALVGGRVSCPVPHPSSTPALVAIAGVSGVTHIAGDAARACGVIDDGTVQCWGQRFSGSRSVDDPAPLHAPPEPLAGARDVVQVVMGSRHACLLERGGSVRCWGHNDTGQLADGSQVRRTTPMPVRGLSGVIGLALGGRSSCALLADGSVRCWGSNWHHEIEDGTTEDRLVPTPIAGIAGATQIAAGGAHACARIGDGTVRCWGSNRHGQLGDGTRSERGAAAQVPGLDGVVEVSCGGELTCARRLDGSVLCWGRNDRAQLGDGTHRDRLRPTGVRNLSDAVRLVARLAGGCAERASGEMYCWGSPFPDPHQCVVVGGGVQCRGRNDEGQLGDGTTTERSALTPVTGLRDVVEVSTGGEHTCARTRAGEVLCWGANDYGQLGEGSAMFRAELVPVVW